MKIHEYQARDLLRQYGITVPRGELARNPEEAGIATATLGGKAIIKAQVLTGGRGKAGAIRAVSSVEEAESVASEILAMSVKDLPVKQVLVAEILDISAEYYAGITVDRETKSVVLIISAAGGMDIEEIASKEPEKIRRLVMSGAKESDTGEALAEWLSESFPDQRLLEQAVPTVENMYRLFCEKDCSLVEINPLAVTVQGKLVAADAKIVFDDNGVVRHPDVERLRNPEEYTSDELEARQAGLNFVSLSGQIGCMVNGAGLAMATMDVIKSFGGSAANFLDVGGSSNPQKVVNAMKILSKNKKLKVILVNIFGGITRCDDVAQGILKVRQEQRINVPIIIRLIGTNEEKGSKMLREAGLSVTRKMTDAVRDAVERAKGGTQP